MIFLWVQGSIPRPNHLFQARSICGLSHTFLNLKLWGITATLDKQTGLPGDGSKPFDLTISKDLAARERKQIAEIIFSNSSKYQSRFSPNIPLVAKEDENQQSNDTLHSVFQIPCMVQYQQHAPPELPETAHWSTWEDSKPWTNAVNSVYVKKEGRFKIHYPCFHNICFVFVIEPEDRITSLIPLLREFSK